MKDTTGCEITRKYILTCLCTGGMVLNNDWNDKSRMTGDCHVRFCERLGLKCLCLLDSVTRALLNLTAQLTYSINVISSIPFSPE